MKLANLGKILGVAVLLIATAAIAADLGIKVTTQKASWRYKMTVEVETPEGLKTGSAVREVTVVRPEPEIQGLYDTRAFVKGEAVVIDLGKRGILFSILDPDDSYRVVFHVFPGPPGLSKEGIEYYSHLKNAKAVLEPEKYGEFARMVSFRNLNDPQSIQGINPQALDKFYGKDVRIKKIIIETTDENISWKIKSYLPWLFQRAEQHIQGYLGGSPTSPFMDPTNTYLNGSEFSSGGI